MSKTTKSLVGGGDRSEKIRTYNFPQGRVSDHRINLTLYNLNEVLEGHLDAIINPLIADDDTKKIMTNILFKSGFEIILGQYMQSSFYDNYKILIRGLNYHIKKKKFGTK